MSEKIIVFGGNGQLGHCFQKLADDYQWDYEFIFADSQTVDITDRDAVFNFVDENKPQFCINAAAYTAVDLAEKEEEKAYAVNADGPKNIAEACKANGAILIHISTDYVFDGETNISYDEDNFTNPQGIYGKSKLQGENFVLEYNPQSIIIRTSWLYSEFNKNFVKTMLHLFKDKSELNVVADQFGQPTNANDLAECIMQIIRFKNKKFGVYHFSNFPETNWSSFAKKIAEFSGSQIKINEISTLEYPTPAKRPV
ncbi:dTDP-4-dehydrorhamnose reductase, partial [Frigoriflavimonas asaccharolytica]